MMDAWRNERLLDQGIQVPENISRAIPNDASSAARHQNRPGAIFVRSIPGRQAHLDPCMIPPQDRDIHLGFGEGGVAGRAEVDTRRRRVHAPWGTAGNPPNPH
eukprot:1145092-Pelagomonas_calceolata.AAC.2